MEATTQWSDGTRVRSVRRQMKRIKDQMTRLRETIEYHAVDMDGSTDVEAVTYMRQAHKIGLDVEELLGRVV